jgi:hypothetical protein
MPMPPDVPVDPNKPLIDMTASELFGMLRLWDEQLNQDFNRDYPLGMTPTVEARFRLAELRIKALIHFLGAALVRVILLETEAADRAAGEPSPRPPA